MTDRAPKPPAPSAKAPDSARVLLGEITTVHGVRGDVVVRSFTADPADVTAYGPLESADGGSRLTLALVRVTDRGVIARIAGVSDRTAAEAYRGTQLWVARSALPPAQEEEFYHADLVGLTAIGPDGAVIGTVAGVENFGAGDLLDVHLTGLARSEYVPFTKAFVPAIDLAGRRLTLIMPLPGDDDADEPDPG
jgi:16S rRNA processing protein RimM